MTCPEAREFYAALIAGELRISEAALVEAHLSRCGDCRQIVESLYRVAPRDSEGRIVLAGAGDMRIGTGSRLLLPLLILVALGASALVVVPGLAPYAWHRASALRSTRLDTAARGVCCHRVGPEGGAAASQTRGTGRAAQSGAGRSTADLASESLGDGCRRADRGSRSGSGRARRQHAARPAR